MTLAPEGATNGSNFKQASYLRLFDLDNDRAGNRRFHGQLGVVAHEHHPGETLEDRNRGAWRDAQRAQAFGPVGVLARDPHHHAMGARIQA